MHFGYREVCSFSVYTPVEDQLLRVEERIFILPTPKSKYEKVTVSLLYLGVMYQISLSLPSCPDSFLVYFYLFTGTGEKR